MKVPESPGSLEHTSNPSTERLRDNGQVNLYAIGSSSKIAELRKGFVMGTGCEICSILYTHVILLAGYFILY